MKSWEEKIESLPLWLSEDTAKLTKDSRARKEQEDFDGLERLQRLKIQKWLFIVAVFLVYGWIFFVAFVMVMAGSGRWVYHPSVLVTLLGSGTASIVGLLVKIVNHVFPKWNTKTPKN